MEIFKLIGSIFIKNDDANSQLDDTVSKGETMASKLGAALEGAGKKMTGLGKAIAPVSAAAGVLFGASIKSASDFGDGMAKMSTLFDTTKTSVSDLSEEFLSLSNKTGISAVELAEAGYQALSAGQSVENVAGFVETAGNLAKAGFTSTTTAVDVLTTAMNAYGEGAGTADQIANKLVRTQNLGKTTVDQLASSMGKIIPTASSMGVNIDNLTSGYVSLTKQGIATAEATTYMNSMLNELGDSGTTLGGVLKEKTGKSFQQLMSEGMSLGDVLQITKDYADENNIAYNELWGSAEAGKAGLAILNGGVEEFNGTVKTMASNTNDVGEALDKLNTPSVKVRAALNRVRNSGIKLGQSFIKALTPALDKICEVVEGVTTWFNNLDEKTRTTIATIIGIVAALAPVLIIGGQIVSGIGGAIGSIGKLWGLLTANPIVLIVAAIAALVVGFIYLWNTSESFRNFWIGLWEAAKSVVSGAVSAVVQFFSDLGAKAGEIWSSVTSTVSGAWEGIKTAVGDAVSAVGTTISAAWDTITTTAATVWDGITTTLSDAWNTITTTAATVWDGIKSVISGAWDAITTTVTTVWDGITSAITGAWDTITTTVGDALTALDTAISTAWTTITTTASEAWNGIVSAITGIWNGITTTASEIWNGIVTTITGIWNGITTTASEVWNGITTTITGAWDTVTTKASEVWNGITTTITGAFEFIKALAVFWMGQIQTTISGAWDIVTTKVSEVWNGITTTITGAFEFVKALAVFWMGQIQTAISTVWDAISTKASEIWNGISTTITDVWEGIKTTVTTAVEYVKAVVTVWIGLVQSTLEDIWSNITNTVSDTWESISSTISDTWESIKTTVSDAISNVSSTISSVYETIKTTISNAWTYIKSLITVQIGLIKSTLETKWNEITSKISEVWETAKTTVSNAWNYLKSLVTVQIGLIKSTLESKWNEITSKVSDVWENVKTTVSDAWSDVKSTVKGAISNVKSTISNGLNGAKDTVSSVLNAIRRKFKDILDKAKNTVKSAIDKIKGFFNFEWSLPKLKLPHIGISGGFSLAPPSVPTFSIEWKKKAMDTPWLFTRPTLFDINPLTGTAKGAGEAGDEVMYGHANLMRDIRDASNSDRIVAALDNWMGRLMDKLEQYFPEFAKTPVVDIDRLVNRTANDFDTKFGRMQVYAGRGN